MSFQNDQNRNPSNNPTLQPQDIKNLVMNQGRTRVGNKEFTLNNPDAQDQNLQSIINDHNFSARPVGDSTPDGKRTYELNGNGKSIKITVKCV